METQNFAYHIYKQTLLNRDVVIRVYVESGLCGIGIMWRRKILRLYHHPKHNIYLIFYIEKYFERTKTSVWGHFNQYNTLNNNKLPPSIKISGKNLSNKK